MKKLPFLLGFLLIPALAWASPTAGTNQPPTAYGQCWGYQPGTGGDFCLNDGSASFWQKFIGDVENDTRGTPQCSPTNTSECGHMKVIGFDGFPLFGDPADGQTYCFDATHSRWYPCPTGGGTFVTGVTATAPLTSSGGITPNISATYQGNGLKIQASTGTATSGHCVEFDANGNTVDAGAACATSANEYPAGSAPQLTGYDGSNAPEAETISGDGTFSRAGAHSYTMTITKINGTTPGGSCTAGSVVTSVSASGVPTCTQKTDPVNFQATSVLSNSQILGTVVFSKAENLPLNCAGMASGALAAATASTVITFYKIAAGGVSAVSVGSCTYGAAGTTCASPSCTATAFAAGDALQVVGPSTADATLIPTITISLNAGAL